MFPSSGLFANINCPFSKRGFCERPHCLYKHDTKWRDMLAAAGIQNGCPDAGCGATVNDEAQDGCIQELERINKEIETVRHEVEQEKRRLSHYQTVQADGRNTAPNISVSKSETSGKHVDKGSAYTNSKTKTYSRARKYVVDNSKPRTDLEYDPLSNFSADLRSYNSSVKDQKGKHGHVLKRVKNAAPCDQKKPLAYQPHLSCLASPLHESNDDGDLIIDLPPSPDTKRRQGEDFVAGKSLQDKDEELKVLNTALDSPPLCLANEKRVNTNCRAENSQGLFNLNENNEYENKSVDKSVFDLAGCLQNGRKLKIAPFQATELLLQKSPEPASPSATTDRQDQTWNNPSKENTFQVELPRCELPLSVENMNPLQPYNIPQSNSLFYKAANLDSPCRQKTTEQLAQDNYWSSTKCVPSVLPHSQKMSSKIPEKMQTEAAVNHAPTEIYLEPAEPAGSGQAWHNLSASSLTNRPETSSRSTEQPLNAHNEVILIESSSEEENELNCSEMEVSDSDTMEECYRIFMEANDEEKGTEEPADVPVGSMEDVEKPEFKVKPKALLGKKRVAHEAKHAEQPVAKSRPQPQVLVPLRGPGPAVSGFASQPSKIQHVQQRASLLSASVKAGQAFLSSASQRMPDTQNAPSPLTPPPENLQPALVENAYMNYISLGTAVIGVGNNLHFILPEGTFPLPVTSSSSQVTSVLTPISPMQFAVKQSYNAPAVATLQRYRQTAPVLIPALARKPAQTSAFATANSSPATAPQAAVKPMPNKRKLKQKCEVAKVPHDVRQRYVNMFTEEFLKTTANVNDAFEKAIAEEKTVYNRSVNKLKYLSVAVNALKRLKNQSAPAAKGVDENTVKTPKIKGNIPLNLMNLKGNDDTALYEIFQDYVLTEERLIESNYPVQHPEKPGSAILFTDKKVNADPLKRICCRCGATYSVNKTGKHVRKEECNYHYGKGVKNKVPGGVETRYSCCEGVMGAPGCQVFKLHVHDSLSLDGFVSTVPRYSSDSSCPGVYSLNCEMIYTIHGLELCRVTVVNCSLQVVYDTFVKPDNEVIDYNTRFSGISEEDVKGNCTSLREVQRSLLSFISADTILIGYGLETDLCALKLLHGMVVDTSVVFPHRLGPPHKLTLNNLTAEYLTRIIQESVCGHDTAEDAAACMELMLWKAKENGKLKK